MSCYTILTCDIQFSHKTYTHKYEVESDLEEAEKIIAMLKQRILAMAVTTEPHKMIKSEDEYAHPLDTITCEVNKDLEALEEELFEKFRLEYLLENWDACHDKEGYAIHLPKEVKGDAFITGDFIYSKEEKGDYE